MWTRVKPLKKKLNKLIKKNRTLVPRPEDKNMIGTKWVFGNQLDENGEVIRNKER